jgi:purine-binding chemotaxis protein CheW
MVDEFMDENVDEEGIEQDQYLVFTMKSQEFGLQAMRVQEISRVLPTAEVPNAPPYIEGIVNLRGRLASLINFRKKFGFQPKESDEDTRIIIVEQENFPIGIMVDSVEEVIKIPGEKVQKVPEATSTSVSEEYITGMGMLDNRLVILLDVDKVLTKKELVEVGAIGQIMDEGRKTFEKTETKEMGAAPPTTPGKRQTRRRAR